MVDISRVINRTVKTDIAGSVDVTISGGSTGKPIDAADIVDGFAVKTVSFAANETAKPVTFGVVDDALIEGTETYRLTMSNPQPSGVFPDGAFVEGIISDNDSSSGGTGPDFGPASTKDTGYIDTKSNKHTLRFTPPANSGWTLQWAIQDSDGYSRLEIVGNGPSAGNSTWDAYYYAEDGTKIAITRLSKGISGGVAGKEIVLTYRSAGNALITVGGATLHDGDFGYGALGTGARIITGTTASPDVQIIAN